MSTLITTWYVQTDEGDSEDFATEEAALAHAARLMRADELIAEVEGRAARSPDAFRVVRRIGGRTT
jgi:hypothetical protein